MTNSKNKTLSILIVIMIFIGCNKENKKTILYQEQKRITLNAYLTMNCEITEERCLLNFLIINNISIAGRKRIKNSAIASATNSTLILNLWFRPFNI